MFRLSRKIKVKVDKDTVGLEARGNPYIFVNYNLEDPQDCLTIDVGSYQYRFDKLSGKLIPPEDHD